MTEPLISSLGRFEHSGSPRAGAHGQSRLPEPRTIHFNPARCCECVVALHLFGRLVFGVYCLFGLFVLKAGGNVSQYYDVDGLHPPR